MKHLYAEPNAGNSEMMSLHHRLLSATDRSRARLLAVLLAGATRRAQTALMPLRLLHDLSQTHPCTSLHSSSHTQQSVWKLILVHTHCQITEVWVFRLFNGIAPQPSRRTLAMISQPRIPFIVLSTECFQFPSQLSITKASMCTLSIYFTYYSLDSS